MKKWILCLLLTSNFAFAATPEPAPKPKSLTPAEQLQLGVEYLRYFIQQQPRPDAQDIAHFLDTKIAPFFDFTYMARSATGRFYTKLNASQRQQMTEEIKQLLLTRLAQGLTRYQNQITRFLPARLAPNRHEAIVSMYLLNPGMFPSKIDFRLIRSQQGWRIVDVAANGQSAIIHYRQMLTQRLMQQAYQANRKSP